MNKSLTKLILLFCLIFLIVSENYAQTIIKTYYNSNLIDSNYQSSNGLPLDHNDDFKVRVRPLNNSNGWEELFEYKTYVNKVGNYNNFYFSEASFVNFDFQGTIMLELSCKYCFEENIDIKYKDVVIRPRSLGLTHPDYLTIDEVNKRLYLKMTEPKNISVEIDGDRERSIHIFTSLPEAPPINYTNVDTMMANLKPNPYRAQGPGNDPLWYIPESGETIYIAGDEVFRGGIFLDNKTNVKIKGRGIIDHQDMPKNYCNPNGNPNNNPPNSGCIPNNYNYLRGVRIRDCDSIRIDGIVINDVQNNAINILESNDVIINDLKTITRVIWGAGVYIEASHDITVDNSFLRTSEDAIPIYAERRYNGGGASEGDTYDITVKNTALYADRGHPIAFGWHGSADWNDKSYIQDVIFENIDILQQDELLSTYWGTIAVNCGDYNYCQNLTFKNIRVEDFTRGALLRLRVEDANAANITDTTGYRIQNIVFENLSYNHSDGTENESYIDGLNSCRYVNGVYFKNLEVNGQPVDDITDYDKFVTNDFVFDISFGDPPENDEGIAPGIYLIKSMDSEGSNPRYLTNDTSQLVINGDANDPYFVRTAPWSTNWIITPTINNSYSIQKNNSNLVLSGTDFVDWDDQLMKCIGSETLLEVKESSGEILEHQEWEFINTGEVDSYGDAVYRIRNNWWGHNSLFKSNFSELDGNPSNPNTKRVLMQQWKDLATQKWVLVPQNPSNKIASDQNKLKVFPNPTVDKVSITLDESYNELTVKLFDAIMNLRLKASLKNNNDKIDVSRFSTGMYLLSVSDGINTYYAKLIINK